MEAGATVAGRLADNIAYFGRALRAAGLKVGPGRVVDAVEALAVGGIGDRADFYWTLHALFVSRHEDTPVFDQAFRLFWRRRGREDKLLALLSPAAVPLSGGRRETILRRVEEALLQGAASAAPPREERLEIEARRLASSEDVLRTKDFAAMSAQEMAEARRRIAALRLPVETVPSRRLVPAARGRRLDLRAMLRRAPATGGAVLPLRWLRPRLKPVPVVALVDISGSMADYSQPILHFLHALGERRPVATFLFGTRLTPVTRALARRDPETALAAVARAASDWAGGTRISANLHQFNRRWSRRVMAQGPVVLLFSDGLEREPNGCLSEEMACLQRNCRRLVWLNPLLRFEGFAPKAQGIAAMRPHVDDFRPVHSLASFEDLIAAMDSTEVSRRV